MAFSCISIHKDVLSTKRSPWDTLSFWGDACYSFARPRGRPGNLRRWLLGRLLSAIRRKALHGFAVCNGWQPEPRVFVWRIMVSPSLKRTTWKFASNKMLEDEAFLFGFRPSFFLKGLSGGGKNDGKMAPICGEFRLYRRFMGCISLHFVVHHFELFTIWVN